jgi:two-component system, OmpR family, sensor kinase
MLRSLRWRLALLFLSILLAAVAVIYLYVVPQLESSLRAEKERALASDARVYSRPLALAVARDATARHVAALVRKAADRSGTRVTLLGLSHGTLGVQTYLISDSTSDKPLSDVQFQVAQEAATSRRIATGSEPTNSGRIAEAARPLRVGGRVARVVVYSSSLSDVQANVELIRRRVLIAGGIALLLGVLGSYLVARALARRVKRLELAAERVAGGDFSHPIPVESSDEIGELALAFNDMQRQLAQLDSARKRFIATASHELRTPIHSLGGFVELLQDEDLDEEERRVFLGQIAEQVERLRNLSVDLLDLSKLEAGSLELHPEPTDLGKLARSVTAEFTPAAAQHRSDVEVRLPPTEIEATFDPERVAQIVRILLDNALTHTPQGTRIEVRAARENGQVRLAVQDHGMGIKRTVLPRVFEPFYTSDDAQGSGLGLAIARELAERMDGRLAVDSVPGRTTFTLELPA